MKFLKLDRQLQNFEKPFEPGSEAAQIEAARNRWGRLTFLRFYDQPYPESNHKA